MYVWSRGQWIYMCALKDSGMYVWSRGQWVCDSECVYVCH